jgi:tetratricopeptide (TPR) repeat protein
MKKALLILFAAALTVTGIFGSYHLFNIREADGTIRQSVIEINAGRFDEAAESLQTVVARYRYPAVQAVALFLLGKTYEEKGDYESAIKTYRKVLTHGKMHEDNYWRIKSILALSQLYRNVRKGDKNRGDYDRLKNILIYQLEEIRRDLRNRRGIAADMRVAFQTFFFPKSAIFRFEPDAGLVENLTTELGFVYLADGQYDEAERMFSESSSWRSRFGLAEVYLESGRYESGLAALEKLLSEGADGSVRTFYLQSTYDLAGTLYRKNRVSEAIALYEKILSHGPPTRYHELAAYKLAAHYYRKGMYNKALRYVEVVLGNGVPAHDEDAQLMKGYIAYDRNQYTSALRTFNQFIHSYPKSDQIDTARQWKAMCERVIRYFG